MNTIQTARRILESGDVLTGTNAELRAILEAYVDLLHLLRSEPTEAMVRAGGRALKDYIESLPPEELAKLKKRRARKGDNAGYQIKPSVKAAVRWKAMASAALVDHEEEGA